MKKNPTEIVLTAPLQFAATDGAAIPGKFSGTAYSGGYVPGYSVVVDMATTQFAATMPLLADHDHAQIIGIVSDSKSNGVNLTVAGTLFSDMPGSRAEQIAQLALRGMPFQMSIGLYAYDELYISTGNSETINGQEFQGPVTVLQNGKVREVSVVALGADPNTDAQFFNAPTSTPRENNMDLKQLTDKVAELSAQLKAANDGQQTAIDLAVVAERNRIMAVEDQLIPGHEALILSLKFDGKSTGGDAAQAVLAAEKQSRASHATKLAADAPNALLLTPAGTVPEVEAAALTRAELDAKAKAHMAANPGTSYVAAVKSIQQGA